MEKSCFVCHSETVMKNTVVSIRQIFNCNFFMGCSETPKRISQLMEQRNYNMKDVLRPLSERKTTKLFHRPEKVGRCH